MRKTKRLLSIVGVMLLATMSFAMAYDDGTPYTVTIKWVVPSDTTFTISLCGTESTIDFEDNIADKDSKFVQPDCQNNATSTPILRIRNDGNKYLNFSVSVDSMPTFANLTVSNTTTYGVANSFNVTNRTFATNVAVGTNTSVYLWTNLTDATAGTTSKTLTVAAYGTDV